LQASSKSKHEAIKKRSFEELLKEREEEKKKINEIANDAYKQCIALGGVMQYKGTHYDLEKHMVCVFPEPVDITKIFYEDEGNNEGYFYVESSEGWNGVKVRTDRPIRVEAVGVKGIAMYDNTGRIISAAKGSRRRRKFQIFTNKRSKRVMKAKEITYYIGPDIMHIIIR